MGGIEAPLLLQVDGIGLNATTFGIVASVVVGLVGAITFLFKWASGNQAREIERLAEDKRALEEDNQHLLETLIDVLRTTHRSTDAADEATQALIRHRRTGRKPK